MSCKISSNRSLNKRRKGISKASSTKSWSRRKRSRSTHRKRWFCRGLRACLMPRSRRTLCASMRSADRSSHTLERLLPSPISGEPVLWLLRIPCCLAKLKLAFSSSTMKITLISERGSKSMSSHTTTGTWKWSSTCSGMPSCLVLNTLVSTFSKFAWTP